MDTRDDGTSRVYRALASTIRLGMLRLLAEHPLSVSDVARANRISVSMASRHLATLADAGLIVRQRSGGCVSQRVTPAGAAALERAQAPICDPADLTGLPEDDISFVLAHGLGAIAAGLRERDRWIERLTQDLGPEWRGRLPTVWEATMRLSRGESLAGLPLPPGLTDPIAGAPGRPMAGPPGRPMAGAPGRPDGP